MSSSVQIPLPTIVVVASLLVLGVAAGLYVHNVVRIDSTLERKRRAQITTETVRDLLAATADPETMLPQLARFRTTTDADHMYLFVLDEAGSLVVNGGRPELGRTDAKKEGGTNISHVHVAGEEGRNVFDVIRNAAISGGGFCHYRWPCPDEHNKVRHKISFVAPVPRHKWIVGCGFYVKDSL